MITSANYRRIDGKRSRVAWVDRFSPIPGLIFTSAICFTLVALQKSNWRGSVSVAESVTRNRANAAILVQFVSHVLGLIQVQALCSILRSSFMVSVSSSKPFSLRTAQFVHSAATPRVSWSLSWLHNAVLVVIVLVSIGPAAVWSGALTPILAEHNVTQSLSIPSFQAKNLSTLFIGDMNTSIAGGGSLGSWLNPNGLFSFDPATPRNVILNAASDGSSTNETGSAHAKLDKTGYQYKGRSYGAGSGAGITDDDLDAAKHDWYSYEEPGFQMVASCAYNKSSAFSLLNLNLTADVQLVLYTTEGELQDGTAIDPPLFQAYFSYVDQDIFAWGVSYNDEKRQILLSMSTAASQSNGDEWSFASLDQMQCSINLIPKTFEVLVNNTSNNIHVTPKAVNGAWPDYGDTVMEMMVDWLWHYTLVDGQIGGSQLGHALRLNVNSVQRSLHNFTTATLFQGVEDALGSIMDNTLIHMLSTRVAAGSEQATTETPANVALVAITLGEPIYLAGVIAINSLITLIYLVEFARTRGWTGISSFDLMDIAGIILSAMKGATLGGENVVQKTSNASTAYQPEQGQGPIGTESVLSKHLDVRLQQDRQNNGTGVPLLVPVQRLIFGVPVPSGTNRNVPDESETYSLRSLLR